MRFVGITLAVLAIVTATRVSADPEPKRSAELQVLDRWIGDWETVVTIDATGETFKTTESRKWSREGTFVLSEDMNLSTKKEAHFLLTYDPNAAVYRACFIEEGNALVLLGTWDKDAHAMRWNATDAAGVKHAGIHRFVDQDHTEWSMVITAPDGKVLVGLSAKQRRRKP